MSTNLDSYINTLLSPTKDMLDNLVEIRAYSEGDQIRQLTDENLELIGRANEDFNPIINVCSIIVDTHANRLKMLKRDVIQSAGMDTATLNDFNNRIDEIWETEDLEDVAQAQIWAGIRDGDSYLILGYDSEDETPTMHFSPAFDGNEGVYVYYKDPHNPKSALYAFKQWEEHDFILGKNKMITRLNVYWENRIEYYYKDGSEWMPYIWGETLDRARGLMVEDGDASMNNSPKYEEIDNPFKPSAKFLSSFVYWTIDSTAQGKPLGLPVVHYANRAKGMATGKSDLHEVVIGQIQDAINASHANQIIAETLSADRIIWATGYEPAKNLPRTETESKPKIEASAGKFLYSTSNDSAFGAIEGSDIRPLLEAVDSKIQKAASLTATPLHFFNLQGQLPAADTQAGLQQALVDKVENSQAALGTVYKSVLRLLYKIDLAFRDGTTRLTEDLSKQIDKTNFDIVWKPARVTTENEKLEKSLKQKTIGLPLAEILTDMGWDEKRIKAALKNIEIQRSKVIGELGNIIDENNETRTQAAQPAPPAETEGD